MQALNKYEVLLASVKWNTMPLEQYQIIALASVSEEPKDDSLKISNSINISSKKGKVKGNKSQSGKITEKVTREGVISRFRFVYRTSRI